MDFETIDVDARGMRISITEDGVEIGRAYLYFMKNDLHSRPFGLMEDVHVEEAYRGMRIGSELIRQVIATAKALRLELRSKAAKCYKLIATSRTSRLKVHELYQRLGFSQHGVEFRIDF